VSRQLKERKSSFHPCGDGYLTNKNKKIYLLIGGMMTSKYRIK